MRAEGRVVSLDVFRGLVIAGMLLVNNVIWNQGTPRQLMHAPWGQGVTFTDMIFPWFMLAMGLAIPFSLAARGRGQTARSSALRIVRRAALLVLLGLLVDSAVAHRLVLAMGVLQLLGAAYLVSALLARLPSGIRLVLAGTLLAAHWALIRFVPVPGVGAPMFEEDVNIVKYLNEVYLQPVHLAGLISVIPTAALVLLGTVLGEMLQRWPVTQRLKLLALSGVGIAMAMAGWLLQWDLPLNKPVWSASYILLSAGLGALLLGVCYLLFDVARLRTLGYPFVVFGANAIVVYVASILFKVTVLQAWRGRLAGGQVVSLQQFILAQLGRRFGAITGGWIYTAAFILFWWLVLLYLYRRQIFVRV